MLESIFENKSTIYTVLGLLNEYRHRKIARRKNEIECFYEGEKTAADLFEVCLRRLAFEYDLQTEIRREQKDTGHIYFYSEELNDLICWFYVKNGLTDLVSGEPTEYVNEEGYLQYAHGKIGANIFPATGHPWRLTAEERAPRLAFLAGAYIRYGKENQFRFGNSFHKARLLEDLLVLLGSPWVRFTRNMRGVPYLHEIEFEMTEEIQNFLEQTRRQFC